MNPNRYEGLPGIREIDPDSQLKGIRQAPFQPVNNNVPILPDRLPGNNIPYVDSTRVLPSGRHISGGSRLARLGILGALVAAGLAVTDIQDNHNPDTGYTQFVHDFEVKDVKPWQEWEKTKRFFLGKYAGTPASNRGIGCYEEVTNSGAGDEQWLCAQVYRVEDTPSSDGSVKVDYLLNTFDVKDVATRTNPMSPTEEVKRLIGRGVCAKELANILNEAVKDGGGIPTAPVHRTSSENGNDISPWQGQVREGAPINATLYTVNELGEVVPLDLNLAAQCKQSIPTASTTPQPLTSTALPTKTSTTLAPTSTSTSISSKSRSS